MQIGTKNLYNREKWLADTLKRIPAMGKILDAGAGEQKYKKYCNHLHYVAQDFAQYDGTGNSRGLHTGAWDQSTLDIISDITSIPEPNCSFDAIMCIEVIEHIPDPASALREFSRLLRPGAQLILTAPFCSLTHFAPYHYYSGFSRYFYEEHLIKNGFHIEEIVENGDYFEYMAQELNRVSVVSERYAAMRPSRLESLAIRLVLKMLDRFSHCGSTSSELLHYGCMVRAIKINEMLQK